MLEELNPKTAIEQQAEQQQEYKLVGSVTLRRGLRYYYWTPDMEVPKEVPYTVKVETDMDGNIKTRKRAEYDPKAYYFQALNLKNAIKKMNKIKKYLVLQHLRKQYDKNKRTQAGQGMDTDISGETVGQVGGEQDRTQVSEPVEENDTVHSQDTPVDLP